MSRRALVTGATSGIGRAIARRLAADGLRVVGSGRDATRGAALDAEGIRFLSADLAEDGAPDALVARAVEHLGGVDVLVCSHVASTGSYSGPLGDVDPADWERQIRVDLTSVAMTVRAALPHLQSSAGAVVLLSSRAGARGTPGLAAYSTAKGGIEALARSVAVDYARDGVRCNVVSPGFVPNAARPEPDLARREAMQLLPLATDDQVAATVAWLAGPESAILTGHVLPVDGGGTIARAKSLG